jgi:hypothetical protein
MLKKIMDTIDLLIKHKFKNPSLLPNISKSVTTERTMDQIEKEQENMAKLVKNFETEYKTLMTANEKVMKTIDYEGKLTSSVNQQAYEIKNLIKHNKHLS